MPMQLHEYLTKLASAEPAPGGGAAVAITGAQAAALVAMALRVSGVVGADADKVLLKLDGARDRLVELADEDGRAFGAVLACYKMPNNTPEEKATRKEALQLALKGAADVPLQVMSVIEGVLKIAAEAVPQVRKTVVSDAAIAVRLAASAISAGRHNVDINLRSIKDEAYNREATANLDRAVETAKVRKKEILAQIKEILRAP